MKRDVIIVGAGAAGLEAARVVRAHGLSALVLEARDRAGGRILTVEDPRVPLPIELGAEFIHGEGSLTKQLLDRARLTHFAVDAEHREASRGRLRPAEFWPAVHRVLKLIDTDGPDESMAQFLAQRPGGARLARARTITRRYVESFHAADPRRISAQSIAPSPGETDETSPLGRVMQGYQGLIDWLARDLRSSLRLRSEVRAIAWRPGHVTIDSRGPAGGRMRATARTVIVTVPVGVLQAPRSARGAITFDPEPPRLREALAGLVMGSAVRLSVWTRHDLWEAGEDGRAAFLHFSDGPFQVGWTPGPVVWPFLVVWSGGPDASALVRAPRGEVLRSMRAQVARALGTTPKRVREMIRRVWWHDWDRDPYARGAYSYVRIGGGTSGPTLAQPVRGTLFFAGEATSAGSGTVEAALASGRRAARQVIRAIA